MIKKPKTKWPTKMRENPITSSKDSKNELDANKIFSRHCFHVYTLRIDQTAIFKKAVSTTFRKTNEKTFIRMLIHSNVAKKYFKNKKKIALIGIEPMTLRFIARRSTYCAIRPMKTFIFFANSRAMGSPT